MLSATPNDNLKTLRHFNPAVHECPGICQLLMFISHKNKTYPEMIY
jgi:hypothetical protein